MLMFRFWNSEHRGSDKTLRVERPMLDFAKSVQPWISADTTLPASPTRPPKRRRQSNAAIASQPATVSAAAAVKRPRSSDDTFAIDRVSHPQKKVALAQVIEPLAPAPASVPDPGPVPAAAPAAVAGPVAGPVTASVPTSAPVSGCTIDIERAREAIEEQFSLEILLKHDEMRLINQELAKCQVALEQLRRCHLIPYPVGTPTPEQMLHIANGSGPALQPKPGDRLPRWAPPFGVTDGPYARHYAKWLIPDPSFDGVQPEMPVHGDGWRTRSTVVEGRSMRNAVVDPNLAQGKGRPSRGAAGQKLHALASGYPVPKDKSGPCVLKRSDGQTVKLVCIDCHRENFSSTQGFINHCRIAHKRDFKSHEEAAVHCGHPVEAAEAPSKAAAVEEKKPAGIGAAAPVPSSLVHPFTRTNGMTESEACFSVVRRIQESLDLYRQGKLPGAMPVPAAADRPSRTFTPKPAPEFSPSTDSPNLSRLLQSRGFNGNLSAIVQDATAKVDLDQLASPSDDDTEDQEMSATSGVAGLVRPASSHAATTAMRIPTRATMAPAVSISRSSTSKASSFEHPMAYVTPVPTPTPQLTAGPRRVVMDEDMLDITELSPNTAVSNNAPSLVSDDGEYDDSADSDSGSEIDVSIGTETIPDVDEIDMDDEHAGQQPLRHHGSAGSGAGTRVRLGKSNSKHVDFVGPMTKNIAEKEKPKQDHMRGIEIDTIH